MQTCFQTPIYLTSTSIYSGGAVPQLLFDLFLSFCPFIALLKKGMFNGDTVLQVSRFRLHSANQIHWFRFDHVFDKIMNKCLKSKAQTSKRCYVMQILLACGFGAFVRYTFTWTPYCRQKKLWKTMFPGLRKDIQLVA